MNQNRKPYKAFKLSVNLLIAFVLLFSSIQVAYAASWNIRSQGDCYSGYPRGASWLNWSGYSSLAWGSTWGYLWHWSGSSWDIKTQGQTTKTGSSNNAQVNTSAAFESGSWQETGAHRASFFTGTPGSYGNTFTC